MKERPILFSTEMVQALLAERKTQTRRVIKPQPSKAAFGLVAWKGRDLTLNSFKNHSPYGQVGDVLWVRETFTKLAPDHVIEGDYVFKANVDADSEEIRQDYIDRGYPYQWKPSIHMPKRAARIWLKVTDVRVERVQDITEEDAKAEGIISLIECSNPCRRKFIDLWAEIHSLESWYTNPWVWVVEFEVLSTAGKPNFENVEWLKQVNS